MADQISTLSIQISSDATRASKAIDDLIGRLNNLSSSLGSINVSGLDTLSNGITHLSSAMIGFKAVGANKSTFSSIASGLNSIASINASGMSSVATAVHDLGTNLSGTSWDANSLSSLGSAVKTLKSIGNTDLTKVASDITILRPELLSLASAVRSFSGVGENVYYIYRLSTAIERLSGVDTAQIANDMQRLGRVMQILGNATHQFGGNAQNIQGISRLANAIYRLNGMDTSQIGQNLSTAIPAIQNFVNAVSTIQVDTVKLQSLIQLGTAVHALNTATASGVAEKIAALSGQMDRLAASGQRPSIVLQALVGSMNLLAQATMGAIRAVGTFVTSHLPRLGQGVATVQPGVRSLGFTLWKLYAQLLLFKRILGVLSKPVQIASNLIEIQNVVDHTFGNMQYKLQDFAKESIQKFGMSELSVKRYASRYQAMGMAMDITNGMVSKATSNLQNMGATLNTSGNSLADMSINLTKLTGDLASFFDEDQAVVAEKLNSVFTGMARPLRAYGIDLTQATLKEFAMKNGLDANVESMTQAEKTMLRYQYVLAQTQHIAGDFERTADTWANQIRQLKQNFEVLGATMGGVIINALKPIVKALNSAIQAVTGFAKVVSDALGFIFGWKYEEGGGGLGEIDDTLADAADSAGGLESGTGGAADNAKKLKSYLMGIDELNILEPDSDSSGGGGGGGGGGGADAASGADADGGQWVKADNALKDYLSDISSLYELGRYISDTLAHAMESINWDAIYEKARNFGTGLASFLNGLITPRLFIALGETIAGALNTALNFLDSFGEKFDFTKFGYSLRMGISACLKGIDWDVAFSALENWGVGLANFLNNLIRPDLFSQIGETIGNALNGALTFLDNFGTTFNWENFGNSIASGITTFFQTTNIEFAAETFSNLANGILTSLTLAINGLPWESLGSQFAEAMNRIDIAEMIINLANLLKAAVHGAHLFLVEFILTMDWVNLGTALTIGLLEGFLNIDWAKIIVTSTYHIPVLFLAALQSTTSAAISKFLDWIGEQFASVGLKAGEGFFKGLSQFFADRAAGKQEFIQNYIAKIKGEVGDGDANSEMGHTGQGAGHSFGEGLKTESESTEAPVEAVDNYVSKMRETVESKQDTFSESGKIINDAVSSGITQNSSIPETAMKELADKLYAGMTTGNGTTGVNSTTYQNIAKEAIDGLNSKLSTGYTETQAPTETWAKGIITWFTGDGAGENKINQEAFTKFANDTITAFKDTITSNYEQTKEPMDNWVKGILAWFTGESGDDDNFVTKTTWTRFATTIITAFKETIQQHFEETKEPIENWAKSMVKWMNFGEESISEQTGLGKKFYDIGENAMKGLIKGLQSKLGELQEVCEQIASAMEDAMEEATEEQSPSKSWMRIGSYLDEGLIIGMKREMRGVENAATDVASAVDNAYKPFMPSYSTVGYSLPSGGGKVDTEGIQNGLTSMMTTAMNSSSDTALMQQQNELLTRIANKNNNVYMDGKKTDALLKQAQRRSGYTFRPQLATS